MSKEPFEIELSTKQFVNWYNTTITYIHSKLIVSKTYIHNYLVEKKIVCKSCGRLVDIFGIGTGIDCDVCYYRRLDKDVLKQVVKEPPLNLSVLSQQCTECNSVFYGLPSGPTVCKPCVVNGVIKRASAPPDEDPTPTTN